MQSRFSNVYAGFSRFTIGKAIYKIEKLRRYKKEIAISTTGGVGILIIFVNTFIVGSFLLIISVK